MHMSRGVPMAKVRIHSARSIADQQAEMLHFTRLAGFTIRATVVLFLRDQVVVYSHIRQAPYGA